MFTPTRPAALAALQAFLPHAGRDYALGRNYDLPPDWPSDLPRSGPPAVSLLSPYIRHRLLAEPEVLRAVLAEHSADEASKFIQEVFWRSYWKGWLELRPQVWRDYQIQVAAGVNRLQTEAGLRANFDAACTGNTEIECFNYWAQSIVKIGYIHNHARMWFASIWVFTLGLPWALGADFFLRHLLDGDPASNTLSWRWVAGMQTKGKTYLATPDNIATFTKGRFSPAPGSLAPHATPLQAAEHPAPRDLPPPRPIAPNLRTGLVLHEDDLTPSHVTDAAPMIQASLPLLCAQDRSPLAVAEPVTRFARAALEDAGHGTPQSAPRVVDWATSQNLAQIVTAYAPVGPVAERLDLIETQLAAAGIPLIRVMRPYDRMCWPKATHGFFKFKKIIPDFLSNI